MHLQELVLIALVFSPFEFERLHTYEGFYLAVHR